MYQVYLCLLFGDRLDVACGLFVVWLIWFAVSCLLIYRSGFVYGLVVSVIMLLVYFGVFGYLEFGFILLVLFCVIVISLSWNC